VLYQVHPARAGFELTTLVVIDDDKTTINQATIRPRRRRSLAVIGDLSRYWLCYLDPLVYLLLNTYIAYFAFNLLIMSVSDEGYSRDMPFLSLL